MTLSAAERTAIDQLGEEMPAAVRAWLETAEATDPKRPLNLGTALYLAGSDDLAAPHLRRALLLDPASARAAGVLVATRWPADPRALVSLVLEIAGTPTALAMLGRNLIRRGHLADGIAALERALAGAPREMDWIETTAAAEWHLHLGERAIARLAASGDDLHLAIAYRMAYRNARDLPREASPTIESTLRALRARLMRTPSPVQEIFATQLEVLMDPVEERRYPAFIRAVPALLADPDLAAIAGRISRAHGGSAPWCAEPPSTAGLPRAVRVRRLARPAAGDGPALPDDDAIRRASTAHRFRDVDLLSGEWLLILPGGESIAETWFHVPGQNRSAYIERTWTDGISYRASGPRLRIDRPAVLIGGADNYYHWMIDFLPRLLCALATPSLAGRRLVVAAQRTAFEQETIDLVDTPAERLVSVPYPAVVECADLVTLDFGARPTAVTGMPVMFRGATPLPVLSALRSRLLSALRIAPRPNAAGGRRLFVVRRDVQRPRLINEAEIADTLAGLGFEAVALSGQSVAAQAALFAEAEIIVGAHGAGLTNALFAPNGAALLELHGVSERPDFFERIAAAVGLRHAAVPAARTLIGDEKRFWHRFATDPARVRAAAVALLDGSRPCPRG